MREATPGTLVSVIYDGYYNDQIFESSEQTGPLEFVIGAGQVMIDFEKNILGMKEGESKTFTLPPEAAHGEHDPTLTHTIPREGMKESSSLQPGMVLGMDVEKEGVQHKIPATVTEVTETTVTVDFNHPLAGKELTYKVTLQSVKDAPTD